MSVHSSGTGSGWNESLDVDQPHGLDYREWVDIRIGTRLRIAKEHETFADTTAGGEHLPGGCRILAIVENTTDLSTGYGDASYDVTTGKFIGRGLVYDQSNNAFWCATNSDGTTSGDPYLLALHPDRIWNGGDVTWAGGHEFDASVDFTGTVNVSGTLEVDNTAVTFGETAGIGLFYDPTVYTGGETSKLGNGLIIKMGNKNVAGTTVDVSFGTAFPNAIISVNLTNIASTMTYSQYVVSNGTKATTGFSAIIDATANQNGFDWIAIGR